MASPFRTAARGVLIILSMLGPVQADDELVGPVIPVLPCRTANFVSDFVIGYRGYESDIPSAVSCLLRMGRTSPDHLLTFSNWRWNVTVSPRDDPTKSQVLPDAKFPGEGGCGLEIGDFNFDGFTD